VGWTAKTPVEKKLVLGVLHRSGHKDFEEANEEQISAYKNSFANRKQRTKSIMSIRSGKSARSRKKSIRSKISQNTPSLRLPSSGLRESEEAY
jgi:hypothetical protein